MNAARHLDDDQCACLVLGLAPAEEHASATAHLRACPACETRLRAHAGAAVRARADLSAGVGIHVVPTPRRRARWRVAAGIAAAAVLVTVFLVRAPSQRSTAPDWLTTPDDMVRMRSDVPADPSLRAGLEAYARHDLPAAIAALRSAQASGAAEQARRLYLGHALLASGEVGEARAWLESVELDMLPDPWREEARRSLAAVWRQTGRARSADSIERAPLR